MMKYIRMAWRNLWRNWRRTVIAASAIVLSMIILVLFQAMMDGMDQSIYGNTVRLYGGNVLIHAPGYREKSNRLPLLPISDVEVVLASARSQPNVVVASRRINTPGLISNRDNSHAVSITAIEPQIEAASSLAAENIVAGRFLMPDDDDGVVIGQALADHLHVTVGDRVSLLGRRIDDSMRQHTMTVVGIFDLGLGEAEKGLLYMNLPSAQTLYNLRGEVTEVALILEKIGQEDAVIDNMAPDFPSHEVDSIYTLRPDFREALNIDRAIGYILGGLLLLMGAVGILNLMLMAVFERTREMGVLTALGMKGRQVMGLFLMEGAFIGLLGAVVGCFLSWLLIVWLGRVGIDYSSLLGGEDMGQYGDLYAMMGTVMYPAISTTTIIIYGIAAVFIAALAALFPAWRASRQEPADSLHHI